jgi:Fe-S cluster biosynthesis and repair protein YggX
LIVGKLRFNDISQLAWKTPIIMITMRIINCKILTMAFMRIRSAVHSFIHSFVHIDLLFWVI